MPGPSPFSVTVQLATPGVDVDPQNFAEACAEQNDLFEVTVSGDATTYVVSESEPGVDDQGKLWVKIAAPDGHLVGEYYFWQGYWRKTNTPRPDSIHMFAGDPSVYFDVDGKGIRGQEYDGFVLCDGRNGSVDMSDKFVIAAHMNNVAVVGYDIAAGWRTNVTGGIEVTGGETSITLSKDSTYRDAVAQKVIGRWEADGNTPNGGGVLFGLANHPEIAGQVVEWTPADVGNLNPVAVPIVPPFYALAYVAWVGYEAY